MKEAGDLRGDAGEAKGVQPCGWSRCGASEGRVITVNGNVRRKHSRYRWCDRCGKTLREAADAKVKTGDQGGVRAAFEQVLERQL